MEKLKYKILVRRFCRILKSKAISQKLFISRKYFVCFKQPNRLCKHYRRLCKTSETFLNNKNVFLYLILIWVGFLWVCFEVWEGNYPCLKLVIILPEIWNLVCKYTNICSFREFTFQYRGLLNFANVSIFFPKSSSFWQK